MVATRSRSVTPEVTSQLQRRGKGAATRTPIAAPVIEEEPPAESASTISHIHTPPPRSVSTGPSEDDRAEAAYRRVVFDDDSDYEFENLDRNVLGQQTGGDDGGAMTPRSAFMAKVMAIVQRRTQHLVDAFLLLTSAKSVYEFFGSLLEFAGVSLYAAIASIFLLDLAFINVLQKLVTNGHWVLVVMSPFMIIFSMIASGVDGVNEGLAQVFDSGAKISLMGSKDAISASKVEDLIQNLREEYQGRIAQLERQIAQDRDLQQDARLKELRALQEDIQRSIEVPSQDDYERIMYSSERFRALEDNLHRISDFQPILESIEPQMKALQEGIQSRMEKKISEMEAVVDAMTERFENLEAKGARASLPGDMKSQLAGLRRELQLLTQDRVGKADFALATAGGSVLTDYSTPMIPQVVTTSMFGFGSYSYAEDPQVVLQPDVTPGRCYCFEGSAGDIVVQLREPIDVQSVTIDHVSKALCYNISSAPKDFEVYGLYGFSVMHSLVNGTYNIDADHAWQNFAVPSEALDKDYGQTDKVMLKVKSNYGAEHTCVYRFRVHNQ
eukprot:Clim_evm72s149 gene=Clim_evmTU72s149